MIRFIDLAMAKAREKGFKGLCALDGEAGLKLAHAFDEDELAFDTAHIRYCAATAAASGFRIGL